MLSTLLNELEEMIQLNIRSAGKDVWRPESLPLNPYITARKAIEPKNTTTVPIFSDGISSSVRNIFPVSFYLGFVSTLHRSLPVTTLVTILLLPTCCIYSQRQTQLQTANDATTSIYTYIVRTPLSDSVFVETMSSTHWSSQLNSLTDML